MQAYFRVNPFDPSKGLMELEDQIEPMVIDAATHRVALTDDAGKATGVEVELDGGDVVVYEDGAAVARVPARCVVPVGPFGVGQQAPIGRSPIVSCMGPTAGAGGPSTPPGTEGGEGGGSAMANGDGDGSLSSSAAPSAEGSAVGNGNGGGCGGDGGRHGVPACGGAPGPPPPRFRDDVLPPPPFFKPPLFGVTFLGTSHGFDGAGSTTGFVIWINGRGVAVDPPPHAALMLATQGIPPQLVDAMIITHCHSDHDAGAVQRLLTEPGLTVLSTASIISAVLRKHSALTRIPAPRLETLGALRLVRFPLPPMPG